MPPRRGDDSAPTDEAATNTPFRAKLEWDGFRCRQAAGDQWGGRDEIYWTAACQSHNYQFHTRTGETGAVTGNHDYPISGEHGTGRMAFFDASSTGNLSALMITCWEADQSSDEWYTALGKALGDAVNSLSLVDFAMDLLATFWEALRNHDDMVLTRGFALNRSDLKALYYTEGRRMTLQFNARSSGMGHFALHVKYTGDTLRGLLRREASSSSPPAGPGCSAPRSPATSMPPASRRAALPTSTCSKAISTSATTAAARTSATAPRSSPTAGRA